MGLPRIDIKFGEAVLGVLKRSRGGCVLLILPDYDGNTEQYRVYTSAGEINGCPQETADEIKMAFLAGASKVIAVWQDGEISDTFSLISGMEWNWMAVPFADAAEKASAAEFIRSAREDGKPFKAVLGCFENADCEGIVNLANESVTSAILGAPEEYSAERYTACIAGLLAGTGTAGSLTGYEMTDISGASPRTDPDADVDEGRLIIIPDGNCFRIARAVTSLVIAGDVPSSFKKIKNVEGADLIKTDIARIFGTLYKGRKFNNYANRQALAADIMAYFKSIEGEVLSPDKKNTVGPDADAAREFLRSEGIDVSGKTDREINLMNTGEKVFLKAEIALLDAMEDIEMHITLE